MDLQTFFERYAELSLHGDPKALAALYAPTFLVAGPQGSQAFTNDDRFVEWLSGVARFNEEHGMQSLAPLSIRDMHLSPMHTLAAVRWGARFEKTGDRAVEFTIAYLLEQTEGGWKVLGYISEREQEEEMKSLGLL